MSQWVVTVTPPEGDPVEVTLEPGYGLPNFDVADAASHAGLALQYQQHGVRMMRLEKTYGSA